VLTPVPTPFRIPGDTVATVMHGGMKTILNGPVKANTGDLVMWIFEFESRCFDSEGRRIFDTLPNVIEDGLAKIAGAQNAQMSLSAETTDRRAWHDRSNGNVNGYAGKRNIFLIKPYKRGDGKENILDRERVFGMYVSAAREYEMCDIKMQTQAI
jgi:hypothetical protein